MDKEKDNVITDAGRAHMEAVAGKEIFTPAEVESAVRRFLEFGEESYVPGNRPFKSGHHGYYSGSGWAARVLRYHLQQLREGRPEVQGQHEKLSAITKENERLKVHVQVANHSLNMARGVREDYQNVTILFDKPLDFWQDLEQKHVEVCGDLERAKERLQQMTVDRDQVEALRQQATRELQEAHRLNDRFVGELAIEKALRNKCNRVLEKAVEQTVVQKKQIEKLADDLSDPRRIREFMGKRIDHWLELEATEGLAGTDITRIRYREYEELISAKYYVKKIVEKLKLEPGTPVEIILDTIQSIQQHADRYRESCTDLSIIKLSREECERLLAIERGHQASFADAKAAEAALERAHADINTFAAEAGFPSNVTADGSRQATLRSVLSRVLALESEVNHLQPMNHSMKEQLSLIRAALKRAGIDDKAPEHVGVCDLATRYNENSDLLRKIKRTLGLMNGAGTEAIVGTIDTLKKPVYGPPPLQSILASCTALSTVANKVGLALEKGTRFDDTATAICSKIDQLQQRANLAEAANKGLDEMIMQIRRFYQAWDTPTAPTDKDIVDCIIRNAALAPKKKIKALREIVVRQAPHARHCTLPNGNPCGCWKADFMAKVDEP